MPYNCCVPQCSSTAKKNKDLMFHKFPNSTLMQKKWLIAIKSEKRPSKYTKICSKHFSEDCYISTSMGQWKILNKTAVPTLLLPVRKFDARVVKNHKRIERYTKRKALAEIMGSCRNEKEVEQMQFGINAIDLVPDIQSENYELANAQLYHENTESARSCSKMSTCNVGVQTIISYKRAQLISYEFLTESQLKHMTGFSKKLLNFFSEHFGDTYCKIHSALSIENELLITLMKYKLNLYNATLASLFDIDNRTVTRIIVNWSKHLYKCFRQINFWNLATASPGQYTVILDCTEFRIERSSDPIIQQATYSTYYGTNTFKVLVGCSENGEVSFVSDIYGGSISDRRITEVSGLLDVLQEEQFVLADRGFDISDILEEKGVHLNIPPFKRGTQLSEEDIMKTRIIANRRIIVENLIGIAKKHKILTDRISVSMWPIINEIVYNCFMMCNFKESIVKNKISE